MSHVIYTCTKDVLTALDKAAKEDGSTREGVVDTAVKAYLGKASKPPKKDPLPAVPEPAKRKESK